MCTERQCLDEWKEYVREAIRDALNAVECDDVFDTYWHLVKPHEWYTSPPSLLPDFPALILKPLREVLSAVHSFYAGWLSPSNLVLQVEAQRLDAKRLMRMHRRLIRMIRLLTQDEIRFLLREEKACNSIREALILLREAFEDLEEHLGRVISGWEDERDADATSSLAF